MKIKRRKMLSLVLVLALVFANFSGMEVKGKTSIEGATIHLSFSNVTLEYNGQAQRPRVESVVFADNSAVPKSSYTYKYENNINAGTATVIVTGKNDYKGTAKTYFGISPKKVTVTKGILAKDRVYDGTDNADLNCDNVTYDGLVSNEDSKNFNISATGNFENTTVGIDKNVIIKEINFADSANNYKLAENGNQTETTGTISQRPVSIKWQDQRTIPYDGNVHKVTASVGGKIDKDDVDFVYEGNSQTTVGNYTAEVTGITGVDAENYILPDEKARKVDWSISRNKRTITIPDISKEYDGKPVETPSVEVAGADVDTQTIEYKYFDDNGNELPQPPKNVGKYKVKVTIPATDNYEESTAEKEFSISKRKVQVTLSVPDKKYDKVSTATVQATIVGLAESETCSIEGITGKYSNVNVGNQKVNVDTSAAKLVGKTVDNYEITYVNKDNLTGNITPREITIKAIDSHKKYGEPDPKTFEYNVLGDGIVAGDDLNIRLNRKDGEEVGKYIINVIYDVSNKNYSVTTINGKFIIEASGEPSPGPSGKPSPGPSGKPSPGPSGEPSPGPSDEPTPGPSDEPTTPPTTPPTEQPTASPSVTPILAPTPAPTAAPDMKISQSPVDAEGEYFVPVGKEVELQITVENADKANLEYQWYCDGKKVDGNSDKFTVKLKKKGTVIYTCDIYNKVTKETKKEAGSWKVTGYKEKVSITIKKTKKIKDILGKNVSLSEIKVPKSAKKALTVNVKKGTIKMKKYCKNAKVTLVTKDGQSISITVTIAYPKPGLKKKPGALKTYIEGKYRTFTFKVFNVKGANKVVFEYSKKAKKGYKVSPKSKFLVKQGSSWFIRIYAKYGKQKSPYSKVVKIKG